MFPISGESKMTDVSDFFHVGVDTEPDPNDPKRDYPVYPMTGSQYSRNERQTDKSFYQDPSAIPQVMIYESVENRVRQNCRI
jgi:hypothetical protein